MNESENRRAMVCVGLIGVVCWGLWIMAYAGLAVHGILLTLAVIPGVGATLVGFGRCLCWLGAVLEEETQGLLNPRRVGIASVGAGAVLAVLFVTLNGSTSDAFTLPAIASVCLALGGVVTLYLVAEHAKALELRRLRRAAGRTSRF